MNICHSSCDVAPSKGTKSSPFSAKILSRMLLNSPGSTKATYHIELCIKGSSISYLPGDSVAIFAKNDPFLVKHLEGMIGCTGQELIQDPKTAELVTVADFLTYRANLSRLTTAFLTHAHATSKESSDKKNLETLLKEECKKELQTYLHSHEPKDVLGSLRPSIDLDLLPKLFSPMLPRFYSISSSQLQHREQIHLTVALFTFTKGGEQRFGVASQFLCHLAEEHTSTIPLYIQPSTHFRLPQDQTAPIIMIGPGTGIAPFRAFLQERIAKNAPGKNWLFFGERERAKDFYYEKFFQDLANKNQLKLSTAFSRDQEHKIYVQDLMKREGKMLWQWLQNGSYLYVCGDAEKMAKEVEGTLVDIAECEGGLSKEEAKEYIKTMRKERRYLCDVY